MRSKITLLAICLIGLFFGLGKGFYSVTPDQSAATGPMGRLGAVADWAEVPATVEELYATSDLIVIGRVRSSSERLLSQTLPIYGPPAHLVERAKEVPEETLILEQGMQERGIEGSVDQLSVEQVREILGTTTLESEKIGESVAYTPFTDSTIDVVRVLKGDAGSSLVVLQLGGPMPAPGEAGIGQQAFLEFSEAPLLEVGESYMLFLKDGRDNEVHAMGRELYELVGPTGQFRISGTTLHNPMNEREGLGLPTTLNSLVAALEALDGQH